MLLGIASGAWPEIACTSDLLMGRMQKAIHNLRSAAAHKMSGTWDLTNSSCRTLFSLKDFSGQGYLVRLEP